jgi:hypothetical protein
MCYKYLQKIHRALSIIRNVPTLHRALNIMRPVSARVC